MFLLIRESYNESSLNMKNLVRMEFVSTELASAEISKSSDFSKSITLLVK